MNGLSTAVLFEVLFTSVVLIACGGGEGGGNGAKGPFTATGNMTVGVGEPACRQRSGPGRRHEQHRGRC